jgi:hypothetical protein
VNAPEHLTNLGIDDKEMPVTTEDDRAININIPLEGGDSVAGRMVPRAVFKEENNNEEGMPAIIHDTQDTPVVREEENEDQACTDREQKEQRLENELRKVDT